MLPHGIELIFGTGFPQFAQVIHHVRWITAGALEQEASDGRPA